MRRLLSLFIAFCLIFSQTAQAYSLAWLPHKYQRTANISAGKGLTVDAKGGIVVDIPKLAAEAPAPVVAEEPLPTTGPDGKPLTEQQKAAYISDRAAKAAEKAAQAEVARKAHEEQRFNDHIQNLANQPGQEWIGQLAKMAKDKPDSVKLQQVNAALEHWDYSHDGLTPAAMAVIAIVVTYFTAESNYWGRVRHNSTNRFTRTSHPR